MRWLISRWGIVLSLASLALVVFAFNIFWPEEGIVGEGGLAELGTSDSETTALSEYRTDIDPWRDELARVNHEITLLRTEVRRLTAEIETRMEQKAVSVGTGESLAPTVLVADSERQLETRDDWDIEQMEWEIAQMEKAASDAMEIRKEEQLARLDAAIEQESVDYQWAGEAAAHIERALQASELEGSRIMDLDCRTTTCRASVRHEDRAAAEEFQVLFIPEVSDLLPNAFMTNFALEGEGSETIVYLTREGYRLPMILH